MTPTWRADVSVPACHHCRCCMEPVVSNDDGVRGGPGASIHFRCDLTHLLGRRARAIRHRLELRGY